MFDPSKPPSTLAELAQRTFTNYSERPYLGQKENGTYVFQTYAQVAMRVKNLAGAWLKLKFERGDRIAIIGDNRREWAIGDLACQMCGIIVVPMFATLPANQVKTILLDSGASAILVSDAKQKAKIESIRAELPELREIIEFSEIAGLEEQGAQFLNEHPGLYESTWPAALPNDTATIIYTSGTTGEPKGVMLAHKNLVANSEGIMKIAGHLSPDDVFLSFLPLAHIYERTAGHYFPLRLGASVAYCDSLFTVDKNMAEVKPTMMTCVPRLYESSREKLYSAANSIPENKRKTYLEALELAVKAGLARAKYPGAKSLSLVEKFKYWLYDRMVYAKIRDKFGGRLKHFISGGAPMAPELGALFIGVGIEILEGYGLTETSPVIAVNTPFHPHLGTVGPALPGVEIRIAEDGEILTRSACVMKGYWNKPEETKAVLDKDGWFATGDIGVLDDGRLRITDRKKDLLVLANGKKVAPQPIELNLQESRYISQAVLLGDKLKSVTALIVPNFPALREWAKKENLGVSDEAAILAHAATQKLFRKEIDSHTTDLADFEKVRKFALLPEPFSAEKGELTPTLKVKRRIVAEHYGSLVGGE